MFLESRENAVFKRYPSSVSVYAAFLVEAAWRLKSFSFCFIVASIALHSFYIVAS